MYENSLVLQMQDNKEEFCLHQQVAALWGKSALFIEDDYVNFLYFNELLAGSGLTIIRAVTLSQALHYLSSINEIKVIVLSASLPNNINNYTLTILKINYPDLPVIIINDGTYCNKVVGEGDLGADMNISRHADSAYLIEAIGELIEMNRTITNS